MAKYYVRKVDGPWWREPHWGFSYDFRKAHAYDMNHPTDRQHLSWAVRQFPGQIVLRQCHGDA